MSVTEQLIVLIDALDQWAETNREEVAHCNTNFNLFNAISQLYSQAAAIYELVETNELVSKDDNLCPELVDSSAIMGQLPLEIQEADSTFNDSQMQLSGKNQSEVAVDIDHNVDTNAELPQKIVDDEVNNEPNSDSTNETGGKLASGSLLEDNSQRMREQDLKNASMLISDDELVSDDDNGQVENFKGQNFNFLTQFNSLKFISEFENSSQTVNNCMPEELIEISEYYESKRNLIANEQANPADMAEIETEEQEQKQGNHSFGSGGSPVEIEQLVKPSLAENAEDKNGQESLLDNKLGESAKRFAKHRLSVFEH